MIQVVVAEDNVLMRSGVVSVVNALPDCEVVGECGSLPELLASVATLEPDLVITDIRMPPTQTNEGIDGAREIRRQYPAVGVIVLSQHSDTEYAMAVFEDGSERMGYLLKENIGDLAELERAIFSVCSGGSSIDPEVVNAMFSRRTALPSAIDVLTDREREVLSLIAEGMNNSAISQRLTLAEKSVQKHINSIFAKLHLGEEPDSHRRVKAVLMWLGAST